MIFELPISPTKLRQKDTSIKFMNYGEVMKTLCWMENFNYLNIYEQKQ